MFLGEIHDPVFSRFSKFTLGAEKKNNYPKNGVKSGIFNFLKIIKNRGINIFEIGKRRFVAKK